MSDQERTKEELVNELMDIRQKNVELGASLVTLKQREEAGQEAQATSKAMIEAFDGLIYVCSPTYAVEFMNERFIQRTGYNPIGEKCYQALHDRDEICPWCVNERVQGGETVRWEIQSPKDNRWYYVVNTPVRHRDGTISKMAMIQDITERKQAEELLRKAKDELEVRVRERTSELESGVQRLEKEISVRKETEAALGESEERYRNFFATSRDGVFMTRLDGQIIDANDATLEIFGYASGDRDELLQTNVANFYANPEDREAHVTLVSKQGFSKEYPVDLRKKDGTIIHVLITTVARRDPDGTIIGFQGTVRDITERKKAEEALRESEQMLKSILSASPVGIVATRDRKIRWANDTWIKMFGFTSEQEYLDQPTSIMHHSQDYYEHARKILYDGLQPGQVSEADLTLKRKNGTSFDSHVRMSLVDASDPSKGTISAIADISDRKKAEVALRESEEKHRTVLASIEEGYYEVDIAGNMTFCNEPLSRMLGYTKEELIGMNNRELMDANNAKQVYNAFNRVYSTGKPEGMFGWELVRKDRTARDVEA